MVSRFGIRDRASCIKTFPSPYTGLIENFRDQPL